MTWVALCSAKGSPGVTTLACVLGAVWPTERPVVVIECDPSGGDVAGRFGLSNRVGMTSLVLTERQRRAVPPDYTSHVQRLPGGLEVLVAPSGADAAMTLDHELGASSTWGLPSGGCDVIADCGRLVPGAPGQARMMECADHVVLLLRPDVAGVAHARCALERIAGLTDARVCAVMTDQGGFKPVEVMNALNVSVLGSIPHDPRGATMAGGGPGTARAFVRAPLVGFARRILRDVIVKAPTTGRPRGAERGVPLPQNLHPHHGGRRRVSGVSRFSLPQVASNGERPGVVAP